MTFARVKICGVSDPSELAMVIESGADAAGFVTEYPEPVPWNMDRVRARDLLGRVPPFMTGVMVTGGASEKVLELAEYARPRLVQLHTDNSCAETAVIASGLAEMGIGLIRALRIRAGAAVACGDISDPLDAGRALEATGISALLIDSRTSSLPAGTGVQVDYELACRVKEAITVPLILAGGLTVGNIRQAVEAVRPYAVDVISGVEAARGVKAPELVREFVRAARGLQ